MGIGYFALLLYRSSCPETKKLPYKIIIIGATSGIGAALARECVKRDAIIGITGRRQSLLVDLKDELGDNVFIQPMDIAQPEQAQQQLIELIHTMQGMDILIVNAGIIDPHLDWQSQKRVVDVNVTGFLAMVSVATEYFIQKGIGHIVGISSFTALRGISTAPVYSASKAFESNYLDGLRARFNKMDGQIYVTDIQPGLINTAMTQNPTVAQPDFTNRWGATPEQAAKEICNAIECKRKHVYITKRWRVIAWLFKVLPDSIFHKIF